VTGSYATAAAFRQALEARLVAMAQHRAVPLQGLRLKVAIERLLARLFREPAPPWLLKGGYSMELRFRPQARTTRDLDLALRGPVGPGTLEARLNLAHQSLMTAARLELADHFVFTIAPARKQLAGAPDGGGAFGVTATLAGRVFASFHVDVGFGDTEMGTAESLVGDDLLSFAGIPPVIALAIPRAQQFAEKVHAYTHPWTDRVNTRSRDLVDMVVLIERGGLDTGQVKVALSATFARRNGRRVPKTLAPPPTEWEAEFPSMAKQAGLRSASVSDAFATLRVFWEGLH